MSCRFIIVGDVHFGKMLGAGRPESGIRLNSRVAETVRLLDYVLDVAIEQYISDIIITGDICEDVKPDYKYIQLFADWVNKCKNFNIMIHVVAGNHDMRRIGREFYSALDILDSFGAIKFYKSFDLLTFDGVSILIIPYRDREWLNCSDYNSALQKIKAEIDYYDGLIPDDNYKIVIGHLALEGAIYTGEDDSLTNQIQCPTSWFDSFDYTWMGHVHKYQIIKENPTIAHIGSLAISDFGEFENNKYFVTFDDSRYPHFKLIDLPVRQLRRINISVPANIENVTEFIIEQLNIMNDGMSFNDQTVRVEIKLCENSPIIDRDKIEDAIYGFGTHYISSYSESRAVAVINIESVDAVDNSIKPEDAVQMFVNSNNFEDPDVKDLCIKYSLDIIEEFRGKE